jgi:hypothetical protein
MCYHSGRRKRDQMLGGQKRGTASGGRKKLEWYREGGQEICRRKLQGLAVPIITHVYSYHAIMRVCCGARWAPANIESSWGANELTHSSQGCRRSTSSMPSASAGAPPLGAGGACLAARPARGARASRAAVAAVCAACGLLTWPLRPLSRSSASDDSMLLASLGEKLPANPGGTAPEPLAPRGEGAGASAAAGCCCCCCKAWPGASMLASPPGAAAKADAGWRAGLPKLVGAWPCTLQSTCRATPGPATG